MKTYWQIEQEVKAAAIRCGQYVVLFQIAHGVKRACVSAKQLDRFEKVVGVYDQNLEPGQVIEDLADYFGEDRELKCSASRIYKCTPRRKNHGEAILSTQGSRADNRLVV